MLLLDELREQIRRVDPDEFRSKLKRYAEVAADVTQAQNRVDRGLESDARYVLGRRGALRLPALEIELERLQGDIARMLALDCSLPRRGDGLQLVHLRARLAPLKESAATLVDLAERSSGGWVRRARVTRVEEQLVEIARLEKLIRGLEGKRS